MHPLVKRYYLIKNTATALLLIAGVSAYIFVSPLWLSFAIMIVLWLTLRFATVRLAVLPIHKKLGEADIDEVERLFEGKKLPFCMADRLEINVRKGDYTEYVSLQAYILSQNARIRHEFRPLINLAEIYFQLDDREKMKVAVDKLNEFFLLEPRALKKYPVMTYYRSYLDGDYDACIEYAKKPLPHSKNVVDMTRVKLAFKEAVAHYMKGDGELARPLFEKVIETGPKLHMAELSRMYLSNIERGELSRLTLPEVLPNPDFAAQIARSLPKERTKKQKVKAGVITALVIVSLILVAVGGFFLVIKDDMNVGFEDKAISCMKEHYEDAELIAYGSYENKELGITRATYCLGYADGGYRAFKIYKDETSTELYQFLHNYDEELEVNQGRLCEFDEYMMLVGLYDEEIFDEEFVRDEEGLAVICEFSLEDTDYVFFLIVYDE